MNAGIYALYWWEQDLVYIGLSQNLCARKNEHLYKLQKNAHTNYKVQEAYYKFGNPEFIILEYCEIIDLADKEVYWTTEFNALHSSNGLCIVEPGIVGFGANSNASKYSKIQILKVFSLLYKGNHSYIQIASRSKTSEHLCADIANGNTHLWLQEQYPEQYNAMCSIKNRTHRKYSKTKKAILQDPNGNLHHVYNIKEFCRNVLGNEAFSSSVCRVIKGTRKSCKGFTLYSV